MSAIKWRGANYSGCSLQAGADIHRDVALLLYQFFSTSTFCHLYPGFTFFLTFMDAEAEWTISSYTSRQKYDLLQASVPLQPYSSYSHRAG